MSKKIQLLLNTAQIIAEEGMQKLTMDHVAKKSNITKGGVLYHFDSKDTLLIKMNEYVIEEFNDVLDKHLAKLSGPYQYTRAYGLATIEYMKNNDTLLPAVFISSLENKACAALWEDTLQEWEQPFEDDLGDPTLMLEFRMLCDGLWFSLMYHDINNVLDDKKQLLLNKIKQMEEE